MSHHRAGAYLMSAILLALGMSACGGGGGGGGQSNADRFAKALDGVLIEGVRIGIGIGCRCEELYGHVQSAEQCIREYSDRAIDEIVVPTVWSTCESEALNGPGGVGFVDCFLIPVSDLLEYTKDCFDSIDIEEACADSDAAYEYCGSYAESQLDQKYGLDPENPSETEMSDICPDFGDVETAAFQAWAECPTAEASKLARRLNYFR